MQREETRGSIAGFTHERVGGNRDRDRLLLGACQSKDAVPLLLRVWAKCSGAAAKMFS